MSRPCGETVEHLVLEPVVQRGSLGSIENHLAGPRHVVALQESIEFLEYDAITRQFHVAHFRGCTTLFNNHMFEPHFDVKSIHVLADKALWIGWAFQAVVSKVMLAVRIAMIVEDIHAGVDGFHGAR